MPPDCDVGEFGFDRFGVRVPTVLVSPLIAPGTVYPAPAAGTVSHLEEVEAELVSRRLPAGRSPQTRPA